MNSYQNNLKIQIKKFELKMGKKGLWGTPSFSSIFGQKKLFEFQIYYD